jgi:hypothetical protein
MLEDAFISVVRAESEGDDIARYPTVLVASKRVWERSVTSDSGRLTDTAVIKVGDIANRPNLDFLGL